MKSAVMVYIIASISNKELEKFFQNMRSSKA